MAEEKQIYQFLPFLRGVVQPFGIDPSKSAEEMDQHVRNVVTPRIRDAAAGRQGYKPRPVRGPLKDKSENTAAPAQPAIPPVPRDPRGPGRLDDPIAGKGPNSNQVGSDHDPEEPGLQGPGDPKGPPGSARVNANGLLSYGKDLSSLNAFTSAFTGGYELTDIKSAFQSNALPTTPSGERQGHEAPRTNYSWDSEGEEGVWNDKTGRLEMPSVPGTTGGKPDNAQDGTSSKPDVAESIRQVRMARTEGTPRGFNGADFSGSEPDDSSLVSPMYKNAKRNKIRSTFLDHEGSSVQAIAAANAVAGYGKDSDGNARFNYGGELVYAKDGMQQKAKNAAMMGQDPTQFLDIPTTPDTQPDAPAASELSMTAPIKDMSETDQKRAAQQFAKGFVSDISGKLKNK